jgi:hypothetical protein
MMPSEVIAVDMLLLEDAIPALNVQPGDGDRSNSAGFRLVLSSEKYIISDCFKIIFLNPS